MIDDIALIFRSEVDGGELGEVEDVHSERRAVIVLETRIGPVVAEVLDDVMEQCRNHFMDITALEVYHDDDGDGMQMRHVGFTAFTGHITEDVLHEIVGIAYLLLFLGRKRRMETNVSEKRLFGSVAPEAIQEQQELQHDDLLGSMGKN